jgi:hypothetical protein
MMFCWFYEPRRFDLQTKGGSLLFLCVAAVFWARTGATQTTSNTEPRLALAPLPAQASVLAWPATAAAYDLEQTDDLGAPSSWMRVAHVPSLTSNTLSLVLPNTNTKAFYRLRAGPTATMKIIRAPSGSLVPDAVVDDRGTLHVVYGLNHTAYYLQSTNNGLTFTSPVKANSSGTVETEMGERGPKLAVGRDGVIHVVWEDDWAPGVQTFVRYCRSLDGGKTFEARRTVSSMSGVDGVTMTADGLGNVVAFWHVMADPPPDVPQATWLFLAWSTNNGATFGTSERVNITNFPEVACSMCMTRARMSADGNLYLAFRSAVGNIRDFYLLKGAKSENRFTAIRVNQDNWNIDYCPMVGPELTFDPYGRALCSFMTSNRVYWAVAEPPINDFRLHVATPSSQDDEIFPTVTANRHGETLLVWQVGPMSTSGTTTVKWARYNIDGTPSGQQGVIGTSFSGTKATAVVGSDDNFYIITTAQ